MTLLVTILLVLWSAVAFAANGETVDVVAAGLVPNSPVDQAAIFRTILAAHGDNTVYAFPAGTYILNNITLTGAKHLTFTGVGAASVWQYLSPPTSYVFMFTCTDCEDITFQHLTIDNRHIERYGGVRFYHGTRIAFADMVFTDSSPRTAYSGDPYGLVFGHGAQVSDTITVRDSFFYRLGLEIDMAHNVVVQQNTFYASQGTTAFGAFSIGDRAEAINYFIEGNHILHPVKCAICFNLDPPTTNNTHWQHLYVLNNTIQRVSNGRYNIRFGTGNTSIMTTGTIFDDIFTDGNTVEYLNGVTADQPLVKLSTYLSTSGFSFTNTHIED